MPMVRAMRLLNAVEAGTTTGSQLDALLLADPGRLSDWATLLVLPGQCTRMAASSTAMTAVAASSTAMTAVAASSTAMTAVAASSTAMTAVIASSTAMTAVAASSTATTAISGNATANNIALGSSYSVGAYLNEVAVVGGATTNSTLAAQATMTAVAASSTAMTAVAASSTAKMACFNSDTALNAIAASSTAMAACRAAAQYNVQSWSENNTTAVTISLIGTSYIVLGASRSAAAVRTDTFTTLRSGSAISLTTANTAGASSTTATDFNCAIPLVAPYTAKLNNTGTVTGYIGLLRCDI